MSLSHALFVPDVSHGSRWTPTPPLGRVGQPSPLAIVLALSALATLCIVCRSRDVARSALRREMSHRISP